MSFQTFTWCPRVDPEGTTAFRVHEIQFGDGYKQSVGDGINNEVRTWPLTFVGLEHEIAPIRDFLRAHKGYKPFKWTPPLDSEGLYEVQQFTLRPHGGGVYTLSATFAQRFLP